MPYEHDRRFVSRAALPSDDALRVTHASLATLLSRPVPRRAVLVAVPSGPPESPSEPSNASLAGT